MDPYTDEILSDLYYNTKNKSAFGGVNKLYNEAKTKNITMAQVKNWLHAQKLYTTYFPPKINIKRNKIMAWGPNFLYEADLGHLPDLKWHTGNYPWILCVIDAFTKFLYVEPLISKQGPEVTSALAKIFAQKHPVYFRSDFGSEFYNKYTQELFKKFDIIQYGARGLKKAAIAENIVRYLKNRIYKFFRSKKTETRGDYARILQEIVAGYNNSTHSAHGMKPKDVTIYNADIVFGRLYPDYYTNKMKRTKPMYNAGDKVRLSKLRSPFAKGYKQNYTDEIFEISQVILTRIPPVYKIRSLSDGATIVGTFYAEELMKISDESTSVIKK